MFYHLSLHYPLASHKKREYVVYLHALSHMLKQIPNSSYKFHVHTAITTNQMNMRDY